MFRVRVEKREVFNENALLRVQSELLRDTGRILPVHLCFDLTQKVLYELFFLNTQHFDKIFQLIMGF
jgi:hypothetical protein